jgi:hypothetical protein
VLSAESSEPKSLVRGKFGKDPIVETSFLLDRGDVSPSHFFPLLPLSLSPPPMQLMLNKTLHLMITVSFGRIGEV